MTSIPVGAIEAFGATCPQVEELIEISKQLGCSLTFQMGQVSYPAYTHLKPLPAQYHFSDTTGIELIVLMGQDQNTEDQTLPPHASRWWLYPGNHPQQFAHIALTLAAHWFLDWKSIPIEQAA